jgi:serine/threonine-protein kinase SRPK3
MTYSNFVYNESNDTFYILVYRLGKGSYSSVWFSLEFENFFSKIKNKKMFKINPRALKIHNEDCYEQGIVEIEVNDLLLSERDKKKCPNINYPLSNFIYDETHVIVVYEVAIGSLYDVMKIFNKKLPVEFVNNIIPQLIKPIEFMHKRKYIHTDIKPENYLLMGLSQQQKDILEFSNSYGLAEKLKKMSNFKKLKNKDFEEKTVQDPLRRFLKGLSNKFGIKDNIIENDDENEDDNEDDDDDDDDDSGNKLNHNKTLVQSNSFYECDENLKKFNFQDDCSISSSGSSHSFYSIVSDESKEDDYETVSSYDSRDNEYENIYDNFHTDKVIRILFNKNSTKKTLNQVNKTLNQENSQSELVVSKKIKYFLEMFKNPLVRLTDFGTMIKFNDYVSGTIQTRYYRAPEIILGLDFSEKIDLWSLGCTIYELATGKILFYTCKHELVDKYDVDLINILMILEKIDLDQHKELFKMILGSGRNKYFLNKNKCINFFNLINKNIWRYELEKNIKNLQYYNSLTSTYIKTNTNLNEIFDENIKNITEIIQKLLVVNPTNRNF